MASLSEQANIDKSTAKKEVIEKKSLEVNVKDFSLTGDEVKFILAKLAQIEFKGVEIEFTYNLIVKLQEHFKYLSKTQ